MMEETWKPIPDYEDMYEISSLGRVRSLDRDEIFGDKVRKRKGRVLCFCTYSYRKKQKAGQSAQSYELWAEGERHRFSLQALQQKAA